MNKVLTNQMKCAIGEQLVSAHLIAQGWPTVNVNNSIHNFKGIDLFCQHGVNTNEVVGIQVKTTFQGIKSNISVGMNCKQAANIDFLKESIKTPWIFVHIQELDPLRADYYVLTAKQMIDLVYGLHKWYLYGWEERPCTESLENSVASVRISHILGNQDTSRYSRTNFSNPMVGITTLNNWNNIWIKDN